MIECAIKRQEIDLGSQSLHERVFWSRADERFELDQDLADRPAWFVRAHRLLGLLIAKKGHLLRACPAPAPRSQPKASCGQWFLAKRPNQAYCSASCQSRATTRASREGTKTWVAQARELKRG
jgi:hypothetical protein